MTTFALAPTTLPETPPLEFIAAAADAGYDAVGLRLNPSPGLPFAPILGNQPLVRDIKQLLSDTGLSVLDIFSFYLEPGTDIESFRPALELGAELGGRYALVMSTDTDWSRTCKGFAALAEMIEAYGLIPALEPAVTRALASHSQCQRLIAETGRTDAVICMDPLNLIRAGEGADDLARMDPRLFPFAQLTDGHADAGGFDPEMLGRMGPNKRAMLGEGDVPLHAILDVLPAGIPFSVETPIAIEAAKGNPEPTATDWARRTLQNAREFLAAHEAAGRASS